MVTAVQSEANRSVEWKFDHVLSVTNERLRYGVVETGVPERYVVFLNGRVEFIEKYGYLPHDLQLPADCGFLTWDHQGQGASGGLDAHIDSFATYADDARRIIAQATRGKPYTILAHSTGALISLIGVINGTLKPQGLCFSSPLLGLPQKPVPTWLARPLANLVSRLGGERLHFPGEDLRKVPYEGNPLTTSRERYETNMASDVKMRMPTFGWGKAALAALDSVFLPANLEKLRSLPLRLLLASDEEVVDPTATHRWIEHIRANNLHVEVFTIANSRHELLAESPHPYNETISHIRSWLTSTFLR